MSEKIMKGYYCLFCGRWTEVWTECNCDLARQARSNNQSDMTATENGVFKIYNVTDTISFEEKKNEI